jgi:DNA (cytosine-5)-methyltransferase 1
MIAIDLFAGCGGLSLGFQQSGFNIVAAFDNWKPAIDVYRENFNHPIFDVDLSNIDNYQTFSQYRPEIIIGSPPCQDFSSAGKRDEGLGRADLTITFAEIVTKVNPRWFVMENVDRAEKSKVLEQAKHIFKKCGYGLTCKILNACYCGVPQSRKRLFVIGKLNEKDNFLEEDLEKNQLRKPMTILDYMGSELDIEYYYRHPRSYRRRAIFSIYEPSPTIRGVNRPIPATYQIHPGDACLIDEKIRPLTTLERSYIQTFPKDFIFRGTKSNLEQMIGNAVPVTLAKYVGDTILKYEPNQTRSITYQQLDLF